MSHQFSENRIFVITGQSTIEKKEGMIVVNRFGGHVYLLGGRMREEGQSWLVGQKYEKMVYLVCK